MAEWPPWQPPPDLLKRIPATMPGVPGNPLGARLLALDDGASRINGTNAPKTIGNAVSFGCIRLVNDDIVDLYSRVKSRRRLWSIRFAMDRFARAPWRSAGGRLRGGPA